MCCHAPLLLSRDRGWSSTSQTDYYPQSDHPNVAKVRGRAEPGVGWGVRSQAVTHDTSTTTLCHDYVCVAMECAGSSHYVRRLSLSWREGDGPGADSVCPNHFSILNVRIPDHVAQIKFSPDVNREAGLTSRCSLSPSHSTPTHCCARRVRSREPRTCHVCIYVSIRIYTAFHMYLYCTSTYRGLEPRPLSSRTLHPPEERNDLCTLRRGCVRNVRTQPCCVIPSIHPSTHRVLLPPSHTPCLLSLYS